MLLDRNSTHVVKNESAGIQFEPCKAVRRLTIRVGGERLTSAENSDSVDFKEEGTSRLVNQLVLDNLYRSESILLNPGIERIALLEREVTVLSQMRLSQHLPTHVVQDRNLEGIKRL